MSGKDINDLQHQSGQTTMQRAHALFDRATDKGQALWPSQREAYVAGMLEASSGVPVLLEHKADYENMVGHATPDGKGVRITLIEGRELTYGQVFSAFGNCGFEVVRFIQPKEGEPLIQEFRIHEWSLDK